MIKNQDLKAQEIKTPLKQKATGPPTPTIKNPCLEKPYPIDNQRFTTHPITAKLNSKAAEKVTDDGKAIERPHKSTLSKKLTQMLKNNQDYIHQ